MADRRHRQVDTNQRGTALALAMLFLLVLTVLAVSSMQAAHLDRLQAANSRHAATAQAVAEYILQIGEQDAISLQRSPLSPDISTDHYYPAGAVTVRAHTPWPFPHKRVQYPDLDNDASDTDADGTPDDATGGYIVEDSGRFMRPGEDASVTAIRQPLPLAQSQAYAITAAVSLPRGTRRVLRSMVEVEVPSRP